MNYSLTLTVDDSIIIWSHKKRLAAWYSLSSCWCITETLNLWTTVVHSEITVSTPEKETRHILLETWNPWFPKLMNPNLHIPALDANSVMIFTVFLFLLFFQRTITYMLIHVYGFIFAIERQWVIWIMTHCLDVYNMTHVQG